MSPSKYENLPTEKSKNGYAYTQIARTNNAAIYEQKVEKECNGIVGQTVGYEVFRILIGKAYSLVQKHGNKKGQIYNYPAAEKFPSNEDGGKTMWSFNTLQAAKTKFEELNKS